MGRPRTTSERPGTCVACGKFPLYASNRCSRDQGYLNLATDFALLCAACFDLTRASALLPFLPPALHRVQADWIAAELDRLANRRVANQLRLAVSG